MNDTEKYVKKPILDAVGQYANLFSPPEDGAREYILSADGLRFKADFAYRLPDEGWLFIEDDDSPLANVAKYWFWLEHQAPSLPVYLLHLIGRGRPSQERLSAFISEQARQTHPRFHYRQLFVHDWREPDTWVASLNQTLKEIAELYRSHARQRPLADEPFIGMWKDREDMKDSVAWVRELRRTEWERGR